jgi:hypothetical protein
MGFELLYKKAGRNSAKNRQNENITLAKAGMLLMSEAVREKLNVTLENFFLIYIDKKLGRFGIKFTKENDTKSSRKVMIQKNSSTACFHVESALKELGIKKLEMRESFKPLMINDVIVIDVKHLIKKSEG